MCIAYTCTPFRLTDSVTFNYTELRCTFASAASSVFRFFNSSSRDRGWRTGCTRKSSQVKIVHFAGVLRRAPQPRHTMERPVTGTSKPAT